MDICVCIVAVLKVCHIALKLLLIVAHQNLETASLDVAEKGREGILFQEHVIT